MHANNLIFDHSAYWHGVETFCKYLPYLDTVSPLTLLIEAVELIYGC